MPPIPSPTKAQLPAEIYAKIIELVGGGLDREAYQHMDVQVGTLLSLCLVSKFIHAVATPVLYFSIALHSHDTIMKLEAITRINPRILHSTRSLLFTSGNLRITAGWSTQTIVQKAVGLRRLCIARTFPDAGTFCHLDGPRGLQEFAALHSSPSANDPNFSFPFKGLHRLAFASIDFRNTKMVTALLELRNLTHLAVVRLDVKRCLGIKGAGAGMIQDAATEIPDLFILNLGKYIEGAVSKPCVLLGVIGETSSHRTALIRKCNALIPLSLPWVRFVLYDGRDWFRDRILDGTLWNMPMDMAVV
jgi:hypothetical protein